MSALLQFFVSRMKLFFMIITFLVLPLVQVKVHYSSVVKRKRLVCVAAKVLKEKSFFLSVMETLFLL